MRKTLLSLLLALVLLFSASCATTSQQQQQNSGNNSSTDSSNQEGSGNSSNDSSNDNEQQGEIGEGYEIITVKQALELCGDEGNITEERYYLLVKIDSVLNATYGEMSVSDETGSIYVYGAYSADGVLRYSEMEDKPYKGDTVLLHCILQNHNGTKEVKNARIIDFEHAQFEDNGEYTEMSIADARTAEVGAKVKISGVVALVTFANGMKPNGLYIVDNTSSIYVYSSDVAGRVEIGNMVTVVGEKTYWILEGEKASAELHGYKGCNQLDNADLVSNDGLTHEFDKSWIQETTVKQLIETPVTQDITTLLFKVNALVKRVDGSNFVNYYFFDIDGETGSYTYTQCSGSDFDWIDEYSGKICTVYLCAMNAKSSASSCAFRLCPVKIIDENYIFNTDNAGEYAVKYHAIDNFQSVYNANPQTELLSHVSSELLGFENATLSYASNNENVAYFETQGDKIIFNLKNHGEATITITGSYNGKSYSESITVKYESATTYEYITVAEAIQVAPNTESSEITVKGIVGPSLVNQNGFYLFGDDGSMIAVKVASTDYFANLEIGHEVILKGTRECYIKDDASSLAGQTCIVNAEILVNNYGKHDYSTAKFVNATGAEFRALDASIDYSTTVFVIKVKAEYIDKGFYTQFSVTAEDGNEISLYMSGAGQYSFLNAYGDTYYEMEIAACNWNDKNYWRGCVIAVRLPDGTKVYNTLNFDSY